MKNENTSRRSFLQSTGAAVIGGTIALNLGYPNHAFGKNKKILKIGLIGCGGRGTGAAVQALRADPDVVLTAMADVFQDHLDKSYNALLKEIPERIKGNKVSKFVGFDAYKSVMASDVDIVLLTTPPAFRPDHLTAAINAGKHVFAEKPMAVDAPGMRKVLEASRKAKEKNLAVVAGFTFRYDLAKRALFERVLNGEIGEILTVSTIRNGGQLWSFPRQPKWGDMEYKLRNWLYYSWLSGDFITEMMVHSLDMMSWAMGGKMPLKATGIGGRQVRVEEIYGNVYDHFAIEYEYENGVRGFHMSRQQEGCSSTNKVEIFGSQGKAFIDRGKHEITGKNKWVYEGEKNDMYQTQHNELFASIRQGKPINDGEWMANSTLLGIWSRMTGYSGQTITHDEAFKSNQVIGPAIDQYNWDLKWDGEKVAKPGITRVI